jgi:hypothetical protein
MHIHSLPSQVLANVECTSLRGAILCSKLSHFMKIKAPPQFKILILLPTVMIAMVLLYWVLTLRAFWGPYRIDSVFYLSFSLIFVKEGPRYIYNSVLFAENFHLSQTGFVATGALSMGCGSQLGLPTWPGPSA